LSNVSMKFRNITKIKNGIINLISHDNKIKRYVLYLTREPLNLSAYDTSSILQDQPDVEIDLVFGDPHIYGSSFNDVVLSASQVTIFVHRYMGDLTGKALGINTLIVDIVTPLEFNILNETEDRNSAIACSICDLVDDTSIGVGKASVVKYTESRYSLTDNNYEILSLFIEVSTSNLRVNK